MATSSWVTMATTLVLVTFLLVCTLVTAAREVNVNEKDGNMTKKGKSPQLADTKAQMTPLEQGMQPIFFITKFFMNNILQPDSRGPPDVLIQSVARIAENDMTPDEMLVHLENNWQQISKYYLGFAICIVIGLLFIIMMPIVGFCFCCCRICGNCGGNAGQMDPKFSRCKHVTYTVFLLLITTLMLAGVVCAFVTNDMFHTQATDKDRGYIATVNKTAVGLEKYMDGTVQELKTDVVEKVNGGIDTVSGMINRTGSIAIEQMKIVTGADVLIERLEALADEMVRLKGELQNLVNDVSLAKTDADNLRNSLSSVQSELRTGLGQCNVDGCDEARRRIDELTMNVDLNKVPDLNQIVSAIDKYINMRQEVNQVKNDFDTLGTRLTSNIQNEIDDAVAKLNQAKKDLDSQMVVLEYQIANISTEVGNTNKYLDLVPKDQMYNNIVVFVGVGLSCLFLLIVMLLYMGMTFGVCGERPYDDARFCNKGVGANFLMASVGFMFLTSSILMLVTLILFLVGAPLQTEVCRHLMKPVESPFIGKIDNYFNIGEFLYGGNSAEKLTIREVLVDCKNNTAIYQALKLNRTYNIDTDINNIITQLEPKIEQLTNDVKNQGYQQMDLVPDDLKTRLQQIKQEADFSINFQVAIAEVTKAITTDLTTYIHELQMLGLNQRELNNALTTLGDLNDNVIPQLRQKLEGIKGALESVKRVNDLKTEVGKIEGMIVILEERVGATEQRATMSEAADRTAKKFIDTTKSLATDLAYMIEYDVGRCLPLYNAYEGLVSATCEDVLYPFNSFWCAFGLCLLLFIPAIIFAVKLAGLYRKTDKYVGKPFESIGGSNVYPGDHIPLDDVRKPPPYRDGRAHGGQPSAGYHDNSTAPPLEYGQGMLDFEMPYAVPARKGLYPQHRDNRPLLDQPM